MWTFFHNCALIVITLFPLIRKVLWCLCAAIPPTMEHLTLYKLSHSFFLSSHLLSDCPDPSAAACDGWGFDAHTIYKIAFAYKGQFFSDRPAWKQMDISG